MKFKTLALLGLLILLAAHSLPTFGSPSDEIAIQALQLTATDFAGGSGSGFVITNDGLTLADDAMTAVYTSPIIESPIPFNVAIPQWIADTPDLTSLELQLRTQKVGGAWSEWYDIHENDDLTMPEDPGPLGQVLTVPETDGTHNRFQFALSFGRYEGISTPVFRQLNLTFIDATAGPTTEEMLAQQAALDAARLDNGQSTDATYLRPTVISREVWCLSVDCDYTNGLYYSPATHMVVHHTVSRNTASDWAAVVRAIWAFHTYPASDVCISCRGWGDIGYNYLVDRTGAIYEGHLNEDYLNLDVIGTHATAANAGSMGVSLIGTFTSAEDNYPDPINPIIEVPPPAMVEAAVDLMAWKADQRQIDVYDASRLVSMTWGLPHLMGHRDVYGGTATTCPGGSAYDLLPELRDKVAQRINFVSPHIYIDELSSAFTKSNNNWYEGPKGCGNNGHSFYTWNVNSANLIENWGEWRPNVPENGRYEIEVYAPYCDINASETAGAIYTITAADGTFTSTVSHQDNVGLWMSLGEFNLNAGTGNLIRLTDLTTGDPTNYDYAVWFDAIRLRPLVREPAAAANVSPASNVWLNNTAVNFSWTITNAASVMMTTLQVATDTGFSNIVHSQSWGTAFTTATHTFSQDYANLYWRIRLDSSPGGQVYSTATRFGLDTTPPSSQVNKVYKLATGSDGYVLQWQGSDALSGVATYTIDYRAEGDTAWTELAANLTQVTAVFNPPDSNLTYQFRARATDKAGNSETAHTNPDADTTQAILLSNALFLPLIAR